MTKSSRVEVGGAITAAQGVVMAQQAFQLLVQTIEVRQVTNADGAPAHLVLIGRPDAATGGADLPGSAGILAQGIELGVEWQDQTGIVGNLQVGRRDGDALSAQRLDLF